MKAYSVKDVGAEVRAARKERGLSQRDLSELCGCGVRFISDLENGKETIEFGKTIRILNSLGLDVVVARRVF